MHTYLKELFLRTLDACSPQKAIADRVSCKGHKLSVGASGFDLKEHPVYVFAAGKASIPMYEAVHTIMEGRIAGSLVITAGSKASVSVPADEIIEGEHPVPGRGSLRAGEQAISFFKEIPGDAIVLNLISGGTSSLMCQPAEDITIEELNQTFDLLNNSGAGIYEMNAVRKHCSDIKGGQLLRSLSHETTLINLIISDVPGDHPAVIGSGPTVPDSSTFSDAEGVLKERSIWDKVPKSVRKHIQLGIAGRWQETLKPGEISFAGEQTQIISSAGQFARQAEAFAAEDGYQVWVAREPFNEPVETVATTVYERIKDQLEKEGTQERPTLLIFYGESTVKVTGEGKGGRNQELALRGALKIANQPNISWLSAGTDGIDGPTDAAGALVDGETIGRARNNDIDPETYLQRNDSYHFHKQMDTLLKTGATGHNLMDVVWIEIGG
ncbi:glycerate kinase type-2 family protein [Fodinibius salsisoli]|uniref:DUF4147 domain-containing protein n=1 Tax=Fodinibius salsisoli TaxID=2820877 RepID=A0ABT3PJD7_9BACT|nr:DUF4147 domain-containing protein [Fodinibius salsisoli]MCW9706037.1 DUF4147 domain-containing protein [Fodinibius salsisoli]